MRFANATVAREAFKEPFGSHYNHIFIYHKRDVDPFVALANLQPGQHVLDLGCGSAWGAIRAKHLVGPEGKVVAVDIAENVLATAQETIKAAGLEDGIELLHGDITNLFSIPKLHLATGQRRHFDVILSFWAFSTTPTATHAQTLQQWREYLNPATGRIIIDHTHPNEDAAAFEAVTREGIPQPRYTICDEQSWAECRIDFAKTCNVASFELAHAQRIEVAPDNDSWKDRLPDVLVYARTCWAKEKKLGEPMEPPRAFVEEKRRKMLERWTHQGREKGWLSNHRYVS
ncbi:MAG: hypothetical protein Q9164_004992 [Protoblastenia rupestris]